jgi:hypothetical protein
MREIDLNKREQIMNPVVEEQERFRVTYSAIAL